MRVSSLLGVLVVGWLVYDYGRYTGHNQCVAGVYSAAERDGVFLFNSQERYVVHREVCAKNAPNCFFGDAVKSP